MSKKTVEYIEGELENIDMRSLVRVDDFLPPPSELIRKEEETVKVTLSLSKRSVDFFKEQANKMDGSYQRMIRNLVDEYATNHPE